MTTRLDGKHILVTGATSGMGRVTAARLAEQGATVVVVGRNPEKTRATLKEIQQRAPTSAVSALTADLTSLSQVRDLARAYQNAYPRLDILIHNAGGMFGRRQVTDEGLEMTFALNFFAPFLLTQLLLNTLTTSASSRIVVVASQAHAGQHVPFEDMTHERGYQPLRVYGESKLMEIMFTYALARRLVGTGVTVNAVHPGVVATNFGKNEGWLWRAALSLVAPFARSAEQGARTALYLASSPEVATMTGLYFVDEQPVRSSAASYDEAAQERLWEIGERLTGITATMI